MLESLTQRGSFELSQNLHLLRCFLFVNPCSEQHLAVLPVLLFQVRFFFRNFFYYSKNFRGLVHCLVIIVHCVTNRKAIDCLLANHSRSEFSCSQFLVCCCFSVINDNFYILTCPLSFVNNFFIFFKTFEFYFNFSLRSLTGQHWKIVVYSSFLSVSLSATNINISYLFYDVNIFF